MPRGAGDAKSISKEPGGQKTLEIASKMLGGTSKIVQRPKKPKAARGYSISVENGTTQCEMIWGIPVTPYETYRSVKQWSEAHSSSELEVEPYSVAWIIFRRLYDIDGDTNFTGQYLQFKNVPPLLKSLLQSSEYHSLDSVYNWWTRTTMDLEIGLDNFIQYCYLDQLSYKCCVQCLCGMIGPIAIKMAMMDTVSSALPTTKSILGFQMSNVRTEISTVSVSKIRSKIPSTHLNFRSITCPGLRDCASSLSASGCHRFENTTSLQMRRRMPTLFANPSEGDIVKEKADGSNTGGTQGPPFLTILAGSIGTWLISLIVNVSPSK
ncbi:hypothetical protein BVC80_8941g20 [Macleaya cordata]|uniref:Uncharacterized protein n=1 Tax=Macleaya cordata TaxID=56857 RepID=A0A200QRF4_MACCD|nr:hypothetical protein BVC80_8941g20 [Macleaya cordata]